MDLRQLETYKTVARSEGFTRASEKLPVSHSAVSRQIKLLEEELGGAARRNSSSSQPKTTGSHCDHPKPWFPLWPERCCSRQRARLQGRA